MRLRNVDKNNDWLFGHGATDYVRDAYAVVLDIKLKLQEWYIDCFFAGQNGIDWQTRLCLFLSQQYRCQDHHL